MAGRSVGSGTRRPFDAGAIYHSARARNASIRKISSLGVTIGSDLAPALATGRDRARDRPTARRQVAWTGRKELGIRFDDSIDVIALLNRELVSQTPRTADDAAARSPLPRAHQVRRAFLARDDAQHLGRGLSARRRRIAGRSGPMSAVFVDGLNIPAGEVVWRTRQSRRRRAVRGVELDLDHPVGAGRWCGSPAISDDAP